MLDFVLIQEGLIRIRFEYQYILDTDVVEDGRDSPEAIIGVHVSNFVRLY